MRAFSQAARMNKSRSFIRMGFAAAAGADEQNNI
jgi:hypothetical protein